jgi:uncharacterized protein (TIGR03083 family)
MPGIYSHQRFCDLASDEITRLATAVDGPDPATPVPTCGRWTMADLVQHIGHIHRWAAAMVADLSPTRHSRKKADLPLPADPATWPAWLAEAQTTLIPALRAADPDARMWAWGPDKHARFWSRRMVHETAVHRVDAELALAVEPEIDPAVATDGISEFLENLPRSRALHGNGEQLHLFASDHPGHWTIVRNPPPSPGSTTALRTSATRPPRPSRSAPRPPTSTSSSGAGDGPPTPVSPSPATPPS